MLKYQYFKLLENNEPDFESDILALNPETEEIPSGYVQGWGGQGFYKPIYDHKNQGWVEGLTPEEISELTKPQPSLPTVEDRIAALEHNELMRLLGKL